MLLAKAIPMNGNGRLPTQSETSARKPRRGKHANDAELHHLLEVQQYKCALTGRELEPAIACLDHKMPKSMGGSDSVDNLQWIHTDANRAKGTMSMETFITLCRDVAATHPRRSS